MRSVSRIDIYGIFGIECVFECRRDIAGCWQPIARYELSLTSVDQRTAKHGGQCHGLTYQHLPALKQFHMSLLAYVSGLPERADGRSGSANVQNVT